LSGTAVRPLGRDDLLRELRPDRNFAGEGAAVSGDQQNRDGNPCREDRKRDGAVSRLSLCTMAMATSVQSPWSRIAAHLTTLTDVWLTTMR
jgi:hypothetical protein